MKKIKLLNVLLVFLTLGIILQFRIQTAIISYDLYEKSQFLKKQENRAKLLRASYEHKIGSERMAFQASGMVPLSSPKVEQVVMIDKSGLVITR